LNYFSWGEKTYIMGILNATPDSFSDGGNFNKLSLAVDHGMKMAEEGADIIDVGGESTRPGAKPVSPEEEIKRVVPVIKELKNKLNVQISVDTYRAVTAEEAIKSGATFLNDVWGLKEDHEIAQVAAKKDVYVCLMHNRKTPLYNDLIKEILIDLEESINIAFRAGIDKDKLIIDPGIGFGKTYDDNIKVMREIEKIKSLGFPVLLGASRKSFIGLTLGLPVSERLEGTIATTVTGIMKGVDIVRVHDVKENKRAAVITDKIIR
jgi:dihydropteroate synthase